MDFFSLSQTLPHFFNAGSKNSVENDTFAIPNDTFTKCKNRQQNVKVKQLLPNKS